MNTNLAIKEVVYQDVTMIACQSSDGIIHVGIKSICDGLGIDYSSQLKRIARDEVLLQGVVKMTIPSRGGQQDANMLDLSYLPFFLTGIKSSMVRAELKEKIIDFKLKAKDVLAEAFIDNKFRNKDLPFDFNFMKSVMENMQQSIMSNNKLLDTVVNTQSDIVQLSTSIIDLTKYIQQRDNLLPIIDTSQEQEIPIQDATITTNNVIKESDVHDDILNTTVQFYEKLRQLSAIDTGYIGDEYVLPLKRLLGRFKNKRLTLKLGFDEQTIFDNFQYEYHEATKYDSSNSFAYFLLKCGTTGNYRRIFVCDIEKVKGRKLYMTDCSMKYELL